MAPIAACIWIQIKQITENFVCFDYAPPVATPPATVFSSSSLNYLQLTAGWKVCTARPQFCAQTTTATCIAIETKVTIAYQALRQKANMLGWVSTEKWALGALGRGGGSQSGIVEEITLIEH